MKSVSTYLRLFTALAPAALALLAAACSEGDGPGDSPVRPDGKFPVTVTAGVGEEYSSTRAVLGDDGLYYWQSGDEIGLFVTDDLDAHKLRNLRMTNDRAADGEVLNTSFSHLFTNSDIVAMDMNPASSYDYYAYFPYQGAENTGTATGIQFSIPGTLILTPDEFTSAYAPMVAKVQDEKPIAYRHPQNPSEYVQNPVHLEFRHVMAYMRLKLDYLTAPVHKVIITADDPAVKLWGTLAMDLTTGTASWADGTGDNTLTIDIAPASGWNHADHALYIPMLPGDLSHTTFTIQYIGDDWADYNPAFGEAGAQFDVPGADLSGDRGRIRRLNHNAGVAYFRHGRGSGVTFFVQSGNHYIEAWGGDGGAGFGATNSQGGISQQIAGLFDFGSGTEVNVYVGAAGSPATDRGGSPAQGGTSDSSFGSGGNGGVGGTSNSTGGNGGGGGAGSFILAGGSSPTANVVLSSGGGGGGGGGAYPNSGNITIGGNGGSGGNTNSAGGNGIEGGSNDGTTGGGGVGGTANSSKGIDGDDGLDGTDTNGNRGGGGAGGGGGGGYEYGGAGGGGGLGGDTGNAAYAGGGGQGGSSYLDAGTIPTDGVTLPTVGTRPGPDGYVIITPILP